MRFGKEISRVLLHEEASWSHGVMVSTQDSESCNPSSNLGGTLIFFAQEKGNEKKHGKGKKVQSVIPCGLVVRIRRFHRRGRGSIPRKGAWQIFTIIPPTGMLVQIQVPIETRLSWNRLWESFYDVFWPELTPLMTSQKGPKPENHVFGPKSIIFHPYFGSKRPPPGRHNRCQSKYSTSSERSEASERNFSFTARTDGEGRSPEYDIICPKKSVCWADLKTVSIWRQ